MTPPDLPTYLSLALSYAGLGAVFGSLLPSLPGSFLSRPPARSVGVNASQHSRLQPVCTAPNLIPFVCQDLGIGNRYAVNHHVTPRSFNADIIALRAGNDQKAEGQGA